jgi:hypothetical protein
MTVAAMERHRRTLALLLTVMGCLYLLGAAFIAGFGIIAANNILQFDSTVSLLPAAVTGGLIIIPLVIFGLLHIITGQAFIKNAPWSRVSLWIVATLNLGNVPLGTLLGMYAIWILVKTRDSVRNLA